MLVPCQGGRLARVSLGGEGMGRGSVSAWMEIFQIGGGHHKDRRRSAGEEEGEI